MIGCCLVYPRCQFSRLPYQGGPYSKVNLWWSFQNSAQIEKLVLLLCTVGDFAWCKMVDGWKISTPRFQHCTFWKMIFKIKKSKTIVFFCLEFFHRSYFDFKYSKQERKCRFLKRNVIFQIFNFQFIKVLNNWQIKSLFLKDLYLLVIFLKIARSKRKYFLTYKL